MPHGVTQRGNRRQQTFFSHEDYSAYAELLAQWCGQHRVEVWAYCLMPNHVHLIVVPRKEDSLRRAIGEAHRRYTRRVNFRQEWRGHLWQRRFASFVMDEPYLLGAAGYVELNPLRAGLVTVRGRKLHEIGLAHEWQVFPQVPMASYGVHMDKVITERAIYNRVATRKLPLDFTPADTPSPDAYNGIALGSHSAANRMSHPTVLLGGGSFLFSPSPS